MAFTSICSFLQLLSETVAKALVLSGDPAVQTAKRKKEEGWADLAVRLRIMAQKGYPDLEDKAKEQLALNVFLSLIDNSQVAFAVRQRRPATLDTAVSATLEIECYADSKSHVVGGVTNDHR